MSKKKDYAELILSTWPKIRDIIQLTKKAPKTSAALDVAFVALGAIVTEIDKVEDDKQLAKQAEDRINQLAHGFGNDIAVDEALDKKFPKKKSK